MKYNLRLELHPDKSSVTPLSRGVDFVGFRYYWRFTMMRKRSIKKMMYKVQRYRMGDIEKDELLESFQGWQAYAKWADTLNLRRNVVRRIYS